MKISVTFAAQIKRAAGTSQVDVELPDKSTVADLIKTVADDGQEELKRFLLSDSGDIHPTLLLFVDDDQVRGNRALTDGDSVSILSPISGG